MSSFKGDAFESRTRDSIPSCSVENKVFNSRTIGSANSCSIPENQEFKNLPSVSCSVENKVLNSRTIGSANSCSNLLLENQKYQEQINDNNNKINSYMSNLDKFIFFKIESYKTYLLRKNISESTINNIINNSINIIEDLDNLIPATNYSKYMLINKLLIDEEKIKKRMKDLTNININIMQKINENNNKIYYILQCVDKIEDKELEENKLDNLLNNLNQSNEYKKLKINELNKELEVNQSTIDDLVKILDNLNEENDDLIKSIEEKELYMYERKEIINNEINNLVKEMENLIEEILQFKLKISV